MTIKTPKGWVEVARDSNEAIFSDKTFCRAPVGQCPQIVFGDFALYKSKLPANTPVSFEKDITNNLCIIPGASVTPAYRPIKLIRTEEIGGERALYYEQVACSPSVWKDSTLYAWYIPSKDRFVTAVNLPHAEPMDLNALRRVLANLDWK
jgi:hypothetical protein